MFIINKRTDVSNYMLTRSVIILTSLPVCSIICVPFIMTVFNVNNDNLEKICKSLRLSGFQVFLSKAVENDSKHCYSSILSSSKKEEIQFCTDILPLDNRLQARQACSNVKVNSDKLIKRQDCIRKILSSENLKAIKDCIKEKERKRKSKI